MKYGYVRKGFPINEREQLQKILACGCDEIFIENRNMTEGIELNQLIDQLTEHDTIIVTDLKVFGKNFNQLKPIMAIFRTKKIQLISLDTEINTTKDNSLYEIFDLFAKIDTECRSEHIKYHIDEAKKRGKSLGRPRLTEKTIEKIQFLYDTHKWSLRRIATECQVSLGSVYKYTIDEAPRHKFIEEIKRP